VLDPQQQRRQLFDALRTPGGYQLDRAVGTTFSLDLLALLTVPLAFTLWSGEDEHGQLLQDPLALLHGVRQVAGRLAIFCQAGQISVPRMDQRLFTYLENAVFEVVAPHREGVFHPKAWLLRYLPQTEQSPGNDQPVRYRFLCLSRNLTFDHSWDTLLVMDGEVVERAYAYGRNHPLADFFAALPRLAVRPLTRAAQESVELLSGEVRRVNFASPWDGVAYEFLPMGLNGRKSRLFSSRVRRQLIVSPFLSPEFLKEMAQQSPKNILISRLDSVAALSETSLQPFQPIYVLDPDAEPEVNEAESEEEDTTAPFLSPRSGLHAKLFIRENGRAGVELFTGSANATSAAFSRNVEFLVKFTGKSAQLGIEKLLVEDKKGDKEIRLLDLLQLYQPATAPIKPNPEQERLEQEATRWQRQLARLPLSAHVFEAGHDANSGDCVYDVTLRLQPVDPLILPPEITVECWPISRRPEDAVRVLRVKDPLATFNGLSYASLTSFFALAVTAATPPGSRHGTADGYHSFTLRFVLNLPLQNAPADRHEKSLRYFLNNRRKVLNYLLFLLAENACSLAAIGDLFRAAGRQDDGSHSVWLPATDLFEAMVRALHRDPGKLDQVDQLVTDLCQSGQADLLPEGFNQIWLPLREAHHLLKQRRQARS
jgi:hypothetical protein